MNINTIRLKYFSKLFYLCFCSSRFFVIILRLERYNIQVHDQPSVQSKCPAYQDKHAHLVKQIHGEVGFNHLEVWDQLICHIFAQHKQYKERYFYSLILNQPAHEQWSMQFFLQLIICFCTLNTNNLYKLETFLQNSSSDSTGTSYQFTTGCKVQRIAISNPAHQDE